MLIVRNTNVLVANNLTAWCCSIFLIVTAYSTLTSPYVDFIGIQYLLGYAVLFLLSFVLPLPVTNNQSDEILSKAIGILAIGVCLLSIVFLFTSTGWLGTRFKGIYGNPNGMGSIAVIAIIYSVTLLDGVLKLKSWIVISIIMSCALCFLFSQSRGAMLAIGICILVYLISERKVKLFFLIFIGLGIILSIVNTLDLSEGGNFQQREYKMEVDDARKNIFKIHSALFFEKPLLGQGLSGNETGGRYPAELAYTDILSFAGIIGGGAFIFALFYMAYRGFHLLRGGNKYYKCNYLIFISILAMSAGDGYISNIGNPLPIFAWLVLGNLSRHIYRENP
ncbi:O-antigen ligase [Colwellia sp. Bg11-12]|uniref:O-antigen ligase family protein n=1 Tax=Colwellia sp. Bg11-12 TaxID=2759817 RepID=UPI0015F3D1D9|nr:O-antigen ligase family protein [Colwellia sp. Bg11-12]MBA6263219.1 O-antigen ligase family protein [Colwellia sp. Bg11-12]